MSITRTTNWTSGVLVTLCLPFAQSRMVVSVIYVFMQFFSVSTSMVDYILSVNSKTEFTIKNTMLGKHSWNKVHFASHF